MEAITTGRGWSAGIGLQNLHQYLRTWAALLALGNFPRWTLTQWLLEFRFAPPMRVLPVDRSGHLIDWPAWGGAGATETQIYHHIVGAA